MNDGKAADFEPVQDSLLAWSRRWNLDEDWCRAFAFFTLATWLMDPDKRNNRDWNYMGINWEIPVEVEDFKLEWAWHPLRTSRIEIERLMRSLFEKEMKKHLDKTEQRFVQNSGAVRPRMKTQLAHFEWLISYQIEGESQSAISKRVNATRQTVSDGIRLTATLCNLTLRRRNPSGHPRVKKPLTKMKIK
jgi:hypothetical protein